jgi:hypothetical protein
MYRACAVCLHERRSEIDARLARRRMSETQIARDFGVSRDSVRSHHKHHVPRCLAAFSAWYDAGRLEGRRLRVCEQSLDALDALAQAERRALMAWTSGDGAARVAMAEIARKLRHARAAFDQLACSAAEAADADEQSGSVGARAEAMRRDLQELATATARATPTGRDSD